MGQIILSQAGQALGSALLPGGLNLLGAEISGAALGGAAGAAKGCTEAEDCDMPGVRDQADEQDYDGDGYADAYDRYPTDPRRW